MCVYNKLIDNYIIFLFLKLNILNINVYLDSEKVSLK